MPKRRRRSPVRPGFDFFLARLGRGQEDEAAKKLLSSLPSGKRLQEEMEIAQKLHWIEIKVIEPKECRSSIRSRMFF
jgi:hypothetical protein